MDNQWDRVLSWIQQGLPDSISWGMVQSYYGFTSQEIDKLLELRARYERGELTG